VAAHSGRYGSAGAGRLPPPRQPGADPVRRGRPGQLVRAGAVPVPGEPALAVLGGSVDARRGGQLGGAPGPRRGVPAHLAAVGAADPDPRVPLYAAYLPAPETREVPHIKGVKGAALFFKNKIVSASVVKFNGHSHLTVYQYLTCTGYIIHFPRN
jgi:hypothetical protein